MGMNRTLDRHLALRLKVLHETIPSAKGRRAARGRMRVWRALTEHLEGVRQLFAYAATMDDRQSINALVLEIELKRSDLASGGALAQEECQDKARRLMGLDARRAIRPPLWSSWRIRSIPTTNAAVSVSDASDPK